MSYLIALFNPCDVPEEDTSAGSLVYLMKLKLVFEWRLVSSMNRDRQRSRQPSRATVMSRIALYYLHKHDLHNRGNEVRGHGRITMCSVTGQFVLSATAAEDEPGFGSARGHEQSALEGGGV